MNKNTIRYLIIVGLIIVGLILGFWINSIARTAQALTSQVAEIRKLQNNNPGMDEISIAVDIIGEISFTIDELNGKVKPTLPVIRFLSKLPGIGGYLSNIEPGLDLASNFSKSIVVLGRTGQPILDGSFFGSGIDLPQAVNNFFLENQSNFLVAETLFEEAINARDAINVSYIPEKFQGEFDQLDKYLDLSTSLFSTTKIIPHILGASEPATFLLLVQNHDEIRPTGGFITAFGILQLRAGRIFVLKIDDSILFDYVDDVREPPIQIRDLMLANYLVPRDANWSPDFPTSAALTQEMYHSSTGIDTDGVMAFDQQFIVDLIEFTGPVRLPGDKLITSDNVEEEMIAFKQASVEIHNLEDRKEFLSILAPQLVKKIIQESEASELFELGKILIDEIRRGHLSVYMNEPEAQQLLKDLDLDGEVDPGSGDYLMLVDANIGFGKIDQFIERGIKYSVDLSDTSKPQSTLSIRYKHTVVGEEECFQGATQDASLKYRDYYFPRCYWDYYRVLLAPDAEVKKVESEKIPENYFHEGVEWDQEPEIGLGENDTSQVGALIVVPQLSEQEIKISAILPEYVLEKNGEDNLRYLLRIQKQNGLKFLPVEIRIQPPSDHIVQELSEGWVVDSSTNDLIWQGEIDRTTDFILTFTPAQ